MPIWLITAFKYAVYQGGLEFSHVKSVLNKLALHS